MSEHDSTPKAYYFIITALIILVILFAVIFNIWRNNQHENVQIEVILKAAPDRMDFWKVLSNGVNVAAKEYDVEVNITGPDQETDIDKQIELIEDAKKRGADAILLAVTDFVRLKPYAEQLIKEGFSLVTIDSGFNEKISETHIATDNIAAGQKAANKIMELLDKGSSIAIISFVQGTTSQLHREQGVRNVLENNPDYHLLDTIYTYSNVELAYEKTKQLLMSNEEIDGIVGLNDPSTVGAGNAIRDLGLQNKVKLVGFDHSIPVVKLIQEDILSATVVQRPFNMGYLGITTALDMLDGKKVSTNIDTGSVVITKENMHEDENQKLLFPFVGE